MFYLFMLVLIVGENIVLGYKLQMAKVIKVKDQLLVVEFLVPSNP
jgi:hypothetical protein